MLQSGIWYTAAINRVCLKLSAILASGIFASGLIWLLGYSSNLQAGIGFDGPAAGSLAFALLGGWIVSAVIAWAWFERQKLRQAVFPAVLLVVVGGPTVVGTGYAICNYAQYHYPDNGYSSTE